MSLKPFVNEGREGFSPLQEARMAAAMILPAILEHGPNLTYESHEALGAVDDHEDIEKAFPKTYGRARISLKQAAAPSTTSPLRVGVVLSGGQAPGGHNVIAGIYDYIKKVHKDSVMVGFADGPQGIYNGEYCIVDDKLMNAFRNAGGFDMIGSGRHKIEKPKEFADAMANCIALNLDGNITTQPFFSCTPSNTSYPSMRNNPLLSHDTLSQTNTGLVIIGGDDSNTNGAVLAEYFEANGCKTKVSYTVHPHAESSFPLASSPPCISSYLPSHTPLHYSSFTLPVGMWCPQNHRW